MAFDPQAATAAYIDSLGAPALQKAAAYTAGAHWLLLWGLLVSGVVSWLVVRSRLLERIANRLARRGPALRSGAIGAVFFLAAALVSLPWSIYAEWWRERAYGRTSQPLGDFLGQALLGSLISAVLGALFFVGVYALMRRAGRWWWAWSGALTAAAISGFLLLSPIVVEPLFNDYKPVPDGPVRDALVTMAQQAGVPTDRIFVFDGSRQSNNFTANVSGIGHSARIAIADVAFKGASLDEVRAVTGHEIGHYVLGHVWRTVAVMSVLAMAFFFIADRLYPWLARAFGLAGRDGRAVPPIADPVGLPVLVFAVTLLALLAKPVFSTLSRANESAADRYSLQTVGLPDALASALVKTAEYRDPRPGALQEWIFYSHPSVEHRVRAAMEWKAAHPVGGTAVPS